MDDVETTLSGSVFKILAGGNRAGAAIDSWQRDDSKYWISEEKPTFGLLTGFPALPDTNMIGV